MKLGLGFGLDIQQARTASDPGSVERTVGRREEARKPADADSDAADPVGTADKAEQSDEV